MKTNTFKYNVDVDEQRRLGQHEQVKEEVRDDVHRELKARAAEESAADPAQVEHLARDLKMKAVREVTSSESDLSRARTTARISQVVDYLFYLVYGVIGLLIVLELMGAREGSGFKQFMNAITLPLVAPFKGLVADPAVGSFQLMLSYVIGLVVYALLHLAVNGALRVIGSRKTVV